MGARRTGTSTNLKVPPLKLELVGSASNKPAVLLSRVNKKTNKDDETDVVVPSLVQRDDQCGPAARHSENNAGVTTSVGSEPATPPSATSRSNLPSFKSPQPSPMLSADSDVGSEIPDRPRQAVLLSPRRLHSKAATEQMNSAANAPRRLAKTRPVASTPQDRGLKDLPRMSASELSVPHTGALHDNTSVTPSPQQPQHKPIENWEGLTNMVEDCLARQDLDGTDDVPLFGMKMVDGEVQWLL